MQIEKQNTKNQWNKQLVLWKKKQDWKPLAKIKQKMEKEIQISKIRDEEEDIKHTLRKFRASWGTLEIATFYQIGNPKINGWTFWYMQHTHTNTHTQQGI